MKLKPLVAFAIVVCCSVTMAVDGIAVSCRYQGKNQNLFGGWGKIYRYDIKDDAVANSQVVFDGEARFATISPDGQAIAFIKKDGNICVVSINGGTPDAVAKATTGKGYIDWPQGDWLYYSMGGYEDQGSKEMWKVDVKTKQKQKVATFNCRHWLWNLSADGKRAALRSVDGELGAGTGYVIHYPMPTSIPATVSLSISGGPYMTCGSTLLASGNYVAAFKVENYGHNHITFRKWDYSIYAETNVWEMNSWGKNMGNGFNRTRSAVNSDEWLCTMQGWDNGDQYDGRSCYYGSNQVLYNWVQEKQLVVTNNPKGPRDGSWQAEAGDFWVSTGTIVPDSGMFTCSDSVNAEGGKPFGFKLTYRVTGMVKGSVSYAKKPFWLNTMSDSVFGRAPEEKRVDTLRAILKNAQEGLDTIDIRIFVEYEPIQNVLPGNGSMVSEPAKVSIVSNNGSVQFAVQADVSGKYELIIYSLVGEKVHGMSWYSIRGENRIWSLPKTIWRSNTVYFVVLHGPGGAQPYRITGLSCP